jgi:hypothetical protein
VHALPSFRGGPYTSLALFELFGAEHCRTGSGVSECGGFERCDVLLAWVAMTAGVGLQQPGTVGGPETIMLAQAHDRCMTTYAVRLSSTATDDEAIYSEAAAGCKELEKQLGSVLLREYPPAQAAELTELLELQSKPNFMSLLQRIRTDRAAKAGK